MGIAIYFLGYVEFFLWLYCIDRPILELKKKLCKLLRLLIKLKSSEESQEIAFLYSTLHLKVYLEFFLLGNQNRHPMDQDFF